MLTEGYAFVLAAVPARVVPVIEPLTSTLEIVITKLLVPSTPPKSLPRIVNVSEARYPVPALVTFIEYAVPILCTLKSASTPLIVVVV